MIRQALSLWGALAAPALADTNFEALSESERLLLGAVVREVLLAQPELVAQALAPPPYRAQIASDLALIAHHAQAVFAGKDLALFVGADCDSCAAAQTELAALAAARGLKINILILKDYPGIEAAFQIDSLPFYVLPKQMLRGAMPAPVLARFLDRL